MASFKKNAFSVFVSFSPEYHCFVWWLGDDDNDDISHRFFQGVPYRCCFIFTIYKKEYPIYPSFEQSLKLFENQIAISFNRSYRRPSYLVSFHLIFFKSSFFFHPAFRLDLDLNHSVEWRRRLPFQYLLKLNICWVLAGRKLSPINLFLEWISLVPGVGNRYDEDVYDVESLWKQRFMGMDRKSRVTWSAFAFRHAVICFSFNCFLPFEENKTWCKKSCLWLSSNIKFSAKILSLACPPRELPFVT